MDSKPEAPQPLVDFSSPKNLAKSLYDNKDAINERVDSINKVALEAVKKVYNKSLEIFEKVVIDNGNVMGGLMVVGLGGAIGWAGVITGIEAIDPGTISGLRDFSQLKAGVTSGGLLASGSLMIPLGKNIMNGRAVFDPKGFE